MVQYEFILYLRIIVHAVLATMQKVSISLLLLE